MSARASRLDPLIYTDAMAYIEFLGAAGTVTGSKHLINTSTDGDSANGAQVLVDCGLFQGQKEWRERNWQDLPIQATQIEAVILTHAHLDHCGWLPRLVKQGFRGPIYATPATIDLCGILLPDSGHLQEEDAAFHNKHKSSKHDPALPLYTMQEAQACQQYFKPVNIGETVQVAPGMSFQFVRASHTLGSAMAEITLIGQPNVEKRTLDNPIRVPGMLSFLAFGTFHRNVPGLGAFPEDTWPTNIELLYYSFHVMAGLGTLFILLMAGSLYAGRKGHELFLVPIRPVFRCDSGFDRNYFLH